MNTHEQKAFEQLKATLDFNEVDLTTVLYNADLRIRRLEDEAEKTERNVALYKEAIQEWRDGKRTDRMLATLMHVLLSEQRPPSDKEIAHAAKCLDEMEGK